jgi:signal transduction histidine kinase
MMNLHFETGLRVLVVDDDALDREAASRALYKLEAVPTIVEASCIAEARLQLSQAPFDCIVLEYLLPEGPCFDFMGQLLETENGPPFVVLTGQGDEDIAVELMKAGASDYLGKEGLNPGRLRRAVTHAVALRKAQQHAAEAETRRTQHAEQLRKFVERSPQLVGARSLAELAEATAAVASEVLAASEVFVLLRHGAELTARRGEADSDTPLETWAIEALARDAGEDGDRLAIGLTSRDGEDRGMIALRFSVAPSHQVRRHVFGQLSVLVSVCSDNLVLYEATARAIRARDDVMAVVSHDLRTPLNNVRLGVNLLRDAVSAEERSIIARVERNVTHMGRLVDDLVDLVRLEGGKLELSMRSEGVDDLLDAASQLIAEQARESGIVLMPPEREPALLVHADRDRVLQVLSNLLGNALKFTPKGGIVRILATQEGSNVRFEVRDTGRGIPAEEGDKIFSRFWRSDPKKRQGLGLGLYIAKGLIQAQGGWLWYQSEEGAGTSFFFTLPKSAVEASYDWQPVIDPVAEAEAGTVALRGERLVGQPVIDPVAEAEAGASTAARLAAVIEDDDDTRALIRTALWRAGFEVRDFGDAESFLETQDFAQLSLVVSDIGLPGCDGIEVCTALQAANSSVPVLLVTAFRDDRVFDRARAVGCEILTKPLNLGQLAEHCDQLARRH